MSRPRAYRTSRSWRTSTTHGSRTKVGRRGVAAVLRAPAERPRGRPRARRLPAAPPGRRPDPGPLGARGGRLLPGEGGATRRGLPRVWPPARGPRPARADPAGGAFLARRVRALRGGPRPALRRRPGRPGPAAPRGRGAARGDVLPGDGGRARAHARRRPPPLDGAADGAVAEPLASPTRVAAAAPREDRRGGDPRAVPRDALPRREAVQHRGGGGARAALRAPPRPRARPRRP